MVLLFLLRSLSQGELFLSLHVKLKLLDGQLDVQEVEFLGLQLLLLVGAHQQVLCLLIEGVGGDLVLVVVMHLPDAVGGDHSFLALP